MKKLFLSTSIPSENSPFNQDFDIVAYRDSIIKLTEYCVKNDIHIVTCIHGEPIDLITQTLKKLEVNIKDYLTVVHSSFFTKEKSNDYLKVIETSADNVTKALAELRKTVFMENDFDYALFVGGMQGVIDEFEYLIDTNIKLVRISNVGGGAAKLPKNHNIIDEDLIDNFKFANVFGNVLK